MKRFYLKCDVTNRILCEFFNVETYFTLTKEQFPLEVGLYNESTYSNLPDTTIDFNTNEEINIKSLSKIAI